MTKMKKGMKKFVVMFLAVMIAVLNALPAFAATSSNSAGGYSIPAAITIQVGEMKTINVTEPGGKYANVSFQYTPTYVSTSGYSAGSYWGKPAKITLKGKAPGTFTAIATVNAHKKAGVPDSSFAKYNLYCKVTVVKKGASTSAPVTKVTVKAASGHYRNVSEAYAVFNTFRTTRSNQWYWKEDNKSKETTYKLKALKRDTALERVAKIRAKEAWTMYYKKGQATHIRPNGKSPYTAFPAGIRYKGENLAWGQTSSKVVITDPNQGWAETNAKHSGQGHRRAMLNKDYTKVGIACYVKDGKTCWAMSLGGR